MAIQNSKSATTGMPGPQPAPRNKAPGFTRDIATLRDGSDTRYGQNQAALPSSILPGQMASADFDTAPRGGDEALATIIKHGHGVGYDWQTRAISPEQAVPTAHGMRSPNASPTKIPSKLSRG